MNSINDFYTKIDINADAVDRIIATSKTAKPHKTINRITVIVSTCAAALVIGIFSVLMFQMTNVTINETNNLFTYSNIEKFEGDTVGGDTLQSHDGIALWINAAYFNGHKMYVAVKGECLKSDWTDGSLPDILKYTDFSDEQAYFSINDIPVKPVGDEIVLTKNRKYYEGVVQFDFENESFVQSDIYSEFAVSLYLDLFFGHPSYDLRKQSCTGDYSAVFIYHCVYGGGYTYFQVIACQYQFPVDRPDEYSLKGRHC